ncbi:MAG: FkbM family methyltransferase [Bacteroidia bacterium]|jgi:FkbM family methyltransferase|nr:FkbM family methyltransferase [Bacteroidia bacterium]
MMRQLVYKILNRMLHSGKFGDIAHRKALFGYLPKEKTLHYVDVGAFHGYFFETVKKEIRIGSAILVEPQPALAAELRQKYGNDSSVKIYETVLSDSRHEVKFYHNAESATSSMLRIDENVLGGHLDTSVAEVTTHTAMPLDEMLADDKRHIDLLKIDVQGAELLVLKGAARVLARTSYIWIEVSFKPLYEGSTTFDEVYRFMNENNFRLISLLEGYRNTQNELLQADCLFERIAHD